VKAALDAVVNKWRVEPWGRRTTIAHAKIGWVRGTGLMGGNDPLVEAVEAKGVHTWSTAEAGRELLTLFTPESVAAARTAPVIHDMTGGLGDINLPELAASITPAAPAPAAQA
ncbi:hypothetical protein R6H00_10720, partial [Actinotignum timonense]|uniref:hypothetical protein n=1 Tax=Actinotignum timonense TaxID=1870995 RepID=UPI002A828571